MRRSYTPDADVIQFHYYKKDMENRLDVLKKDAFAQPMTVLNRCFQGDTEKSNPKAKE